MYFVTFPTGQLLQHENTIVGSLYHQLAVSRFLVNVKRNPVLSHRDLDQADFLIRKMNALEAILVHLI